MINIAVQLNGAVRTETFLGREFVVAPAVLVRSQVLHNNLGVTYLPSDELTEDWAKAWNGIPVIVGPHPSDRGVAISGRSPEIWNARCAGWIFNAKIKDESESVRNLSAEVWLDKARAESVEGLQAVLDKLTANEVVELSTGFNVNVVQSAGVFQGSAYEAVMHPAEPDHLVISTEFTGACSVSDGCGLGVNKYQGAPPVVHAGTQANINSSEQSMPQAEATTSDSLTKKVWERVKAAFGTQRDEADKSIQQKLALDEHAHAVHSMPVSDSEKANRLRTALQDQYGSRGEVIVSDVFSTEGIVVFWLITPLGSEPQGPEYFRATFTEGSEGAVTFGEPERVIRVTAYEPVGNAAGNTSPIVATNCSCSPKPTEGVTMPDDNKSALDAIAASITALTSKVDGLATEVTNLKQAAESDPNPAIGGLKRSIADLASKFETMQTVTQTAVQEKERERRSLIDNLAGNFKCPFTAPELEAKPLAELQKLHEMVSADYSGKGGPRSGVVNTRDEAFMPTRPYWEVEDKNAQRGGK